MVVQSHTMAQEPIGISFYGSHMDLQPGESPRQWQQRQSANRQTPTPAPTADRRAAQDANAKELKALADDTAKLRAAVDSQSGAAPPSEPEQKPKGFAAKLKFGGALNAFGGKHPQKSE